MVPVKIRYFFARPPVQRIVGVFKKGFIILGHVPAFVDIRARQFAVLPDSRLEIIHNDSHPIDVRKVDFSVAVHIHKTSQGLRDLIQVFLIHSPVGHDIRTAHHLRRNGLRHTIRAYQPFDPFQIPLIHDTVAVHVAGLLDDIFKVIRIHHRHLPVLVDIRQSNLLGSDVHSGVFNDVVDSGHIKAADEPVAVHIHQMSRDFDKFFIVKDIDDPVVIDIGPLGLRRRKRRFKSGNLVDDGKIVLVHLAVLVNIHVIRQGILQSGQIVVIDHAVSVHIRPLPVLGAHTEGEEIHDFPRAVHIAGVDSQILVHIHKINQYIIEQVNIFHVHGTVAVQIRFLNHVRRKHYAQDLSRIGRRVIRVGPQIVFFVIAEAVAVRVRIQRICVLGYLQVIRNSIAVTVFRRGRRLGSIALRIGAEFQFFAVAEAVAVRVHHVKISPQLIFHNIADAVRIRVGFGIVLCIHRIRSVRLFIVVAFTVLVGIHHGGGAVVLVIGIAAVQALKGIAFAVPVRVQPAGEIRRVKRVRSCRGFDFVRKTVPVAIQPAVADRIIGIRTIGQL